MKTTIRLILIFLAAALQQGALTAAAAHQRALEPAWTQLFNGQDLTGWKTSGDTRLKPLEQTPAPAPGGRGQGPQAPVFTSPEVSADRRVTFRLYAPEAAGVSIRASDIPAAARQDA